MIIAIFMAILTTFDKKFNFFPCCTLSSSSHHIYLVASWHYHIEQSVQRISIESVHLLWNRIALDMLKWYWFEWETKLSLELS